MRLVLMAAVLAAATAFASAADTTTTAKARHAATAKKKKKAGKPDHWHQRVKDIRAELKALPPETSNTIVMVGDSITEGFKRANDIHELNGHTVINEGISGDQVDRPSSGTGVTFRVPLIAKAKPEVVFVQIGINDFWGGKEEVPDVAQQYEKMLKMMRSAMPNTRIVVVSLFPTAKKNAYLNPKVNEFNKLLPGMAKSINADYLDLHSRLTDAKGELKDEYTVDGVHFKPPAYTVWIDAMKQETANLAK